jgi:hypothetical protein
MGEQQAFRVFRIADAVVQVVPVQSIHAAIRRVTAGAALPALETDAAVVEEEFSAAGESHGRGLLQ